MREILFKAQRVDTKAWVEGFYACLTDNHTKTNKHFIQSFKKLENGEIIWTFMHDVIPETVSQYTGLTDEKSVKIFEGDIFEMTDGTTATVEWEKEARFLGFTSDRRIVYINRVPRKVKVIGNIYEEAKQ